MTPPRADSRTSARDALTDVGFDGVRQLDVLTFESPPDRMIEGRVALDQVDLGPELNLLGLQQVPLSVHDVAGGRQSRLELGLLSRQSSLGRLHARNGGIQAGFALLDLRQGLAYLQRNRLFQIRAICAWALWARASVLKMGNCSWACTR